MLIHVYHVKLTLNMCNLSLAQTKFGRRSHVVGSEIAPFEMHASHNFYFSRMRANSNVIYQLIIIINSRLALEIASETFVTVRSVRKFIIHSFSKIESTPTAPGDAPKESVTITDSGKLRAVHLSALN